MKTTDKAIRGLAAQVAADLRSGALTLGQVVGLTDEEKAAIAQLAAQHRRQGNLELAASVYGLLLTYDPYAAAQWESLADVQARLGRHPVAVSCYEIVALLRDPDRRLTEKEARCLRLMGQPELAADLLAAAGQ